MSPKIWYGKRGTAVEDEDNRLILRKFRAPQGDVALMVDYQDYLLAYYIGNNTYGVYPLRYGTTTAPLGSASCNSLRDVHFAKLAVLQDEDWVGITYSTPFSTGGPNVRYYDTYTKYHTTTGAYFEFTTPDWTRRVGIIGNGNTVNGLAKVEIDGDATLATYLPTANDLVTAGTFPNTILVANGGTLNPTDRVLDQYSAAIDYAPINLFADNLTAGVHTVRVTCTGYKRAAASQNRLYVDGVFYGDDYMDLSEDNVILVPVMQVVPETSGIQEYALRWYPSGAAYTDFIGNSHGWDFQTDLDVYIDHVQTSIGALLFETYSGSEQIAVRRISELRHPEVGGGATVIGTVDCLYTIKPVTGLEIEYTLTWQSAGVLATSYTGMMTCSMDYSRGSTIGLGAMDTFDADNNSVQANSRSDIAWLYRHDVGSFPQIGADAHACMFYARNWPDQVRNHILSPNYQLWIIDGSASKKMYMTYLDASASTSTTVSGEQIVAKNNYRVMYFPDQDAPSQLGW